MQVDFMKYAFEISDVPGDYLRDCDFLRFAGCLKQMPNAATDRVEIVRTQQHHCENNELVEIVGPPVKP